MASFPIFYLIWVFAICFSGVIIPLGILTAWRVNSQFLLKKQPLKQSRRVGYFVIVYVIIAVLFYLLEVALRPFVDSSVFFAYATIVILDLLYIGLGIFYFCMFLWIRFFRYNRLLIFLAIFLIFTSMTVFLHDYIIEANAGFHFFNPATWHLLHLGVHHLYIGFIGMILCWYFFFLVIRKVVAEVAPKFNRFHAFILLRIGVSPIIFIFPFWGIILLSALDVVDGFIYSHVMKGPFLTVFGEKELKSDYHKYDKIADIFNEVAMVLYAGLIWQDFFLISLFVWRMLGVIIWYYKPNSWVLFVFPNVFANFWIVTVFVDRIMPSFQIILETYFIPLFILTLLITMVHEYLLHVIRYKKEMSWKEGLRIVKKYIVFIIFIMSAIYVAVIPPPHPLWFPQWVLIPIFFGIFMIGFLLYHLFQYKGYNTYHLRHTALKVKIERRFSITAIKIVVINIFVLRLLFGAIFSIELIFVYLILQEVIDWIDSLLIINFENERTWRTFDDLVDWVSRLIFFFPLLYLPFLPFVFVYYFIVIGLTFVSFEFRWLKVFGINPLYVMGFYFFCPILFYPACVVSFGLYFALFYKSKQEIEEELEIRGMRK